MECLYTTQFAHFGRVRFFLKLNYPLWKLDNASAEFQINRIIRARE